VSDTFDAYVLAEQARPCSGNSVSETCRNYKDGLAMTVKGRIARRFPMVRGEKEEPG
jgi:hypothetical protein